MKKGLVSSVAVLVWGLGLSLSSDPMSLAAAAPVTDNTRIQVAVDPTGYANPAAASSIADSVIAQIVEKQFAELNKPTAADILALADNDDDDFFDEELVRRRDEMLRENRRRAAEEAAAALRRKAQKQQQQQATDEDVLSKPIPRKSHDYSWKNTPQLSDLWRIIHEGTLDELKRFVRMNPDVIHHRSEDGRGPLWWAYEYGKKDMIKALLDWGVTTSERDSQGKTPQMMAK